MQSLPYEVWEYITTFLPSKVVEDLLTVNSSIFDIAMNERYRTTSFRSICGKDTLRCVKRLVDMNVAARVRTFRFMPSGVTLLNMFKEGGGHIIAAEQISQSTLSYRGTHNSFSLAMTPDDVTRSLPHRFYVQAFTVDIFSAPILSFYFVDKRSPPQPTLLA
ncbi:hypothetical protein HYPSUDRAFT_69046 [Hypholoma sublateritium FD-334 SS-4]|uniref:F-box domain-containing protein n=1 Tax=Hypholoma sublateritium (strain FD-334 SS-4) TaxID=945553 RepID=A0A0D2M960_HYPSF|nr:hypothetical protein HYPSUDRAFT_69046 [Hypholoma sublateritium FD-334 SS-4]